MPCPHVFGDMNPKLWRDSWTGVPTPTVADRTLHNQAAGVHGGGGRDGGAAADGNVDSMGKMGRSKRRAGWFAVLCKSAM